MALGDPINIDVTVSGETNTVVSFQGGDTNVTQYSGGNSIVSTLSENTSSVSLESGYNVDVNFTGASTSVQNAAYVIGSSATPFSCSDLTACNLFESGDITGFGNIGISGSGDYLIISGSAGAASIEVKNKGVTKTSAVSSLDFNQGYSITNVGPAVTIDSSLGIDNLTTAQCDALLAQCEDRNASGIYSGQNGDTFYFRGLIGTGSITVTGYPGNDNFIYISGEQFYPNSNPSGFITGVNSGHLLTGASNIGTGSGIYSGTLENDLKFKTLIAGPNIALSGDGQHIMISGTEGGGGGGGGSTQTASNIGTSGASGIYSGTISDDFKLRSISSVSPLSVTGSTDDTQIIISGNGIITGAKNIGLPTASGIYSGAHSSTNCRRRGISFWLYDDNYTGNTTDNTKDDYVWGPMMDSGEYGVQFDTRPSGSPWYYGTVLDGTQWLSGHVYRVNGTWENQSDDSMLFFKGGKQMTSTLHGGAAHDSLAGHITFPNGAGPENLQGQNDPHEILHSRDQHYEWTGSPFDFGNKNWEISYDFVWQNSEYSTPKNQVFLDNFSNTHGGLMIAQALDDQIYTIPIGALGLVFAGKVYRGIDSDSSMSSGAVWTTGLGAAEFTPPGTGTNGGYLSLRCGRGLDLNENASPPASSQTNKSHFYTKEENDNYISLWLSGTLSTGYEVQAIYPVDPNFHILGSQYFPKGGGYSTWWNPEGLEAKANGSVYLMDSRFSIGEWEGAKAYINNFKVEHENFKCRDSDHSNPDTLLFKKLKGISGVEVTGSGDNTDTLFISGQTGNFYDKSNPSGFITGVDSGHLLDGVSNAGIGSGVFSGTINGDVKLRSISGVGLVTITGYEDNTILVSGAHGGVNWTLPPPACPTGIGTTGQISFDDVYYYICIRENTWRRVAISEWSC